MSASGIEPGDHPDDREDRRPPVSPTEGTDQLATIGSRAWARILDGLIIGIPLAVLIMVTSEVDTGKETLRIPLAVQVATTLVAAAYEVILIHLRGQTIGKRIVGIRAVRVNDGAHPDWTASSMRYLLPALPALIPIPGAFLLSPVVYLAAIPDPLRRGWHDRAAGTIVVKATAPDAGDGLSAR